jgi:hypothetical protein
VSFHLRHSIAAPFEACVLAIPFKNRGVPVHLEGVQVAPATMSEPLLDPGNACLVWRLGDSLPR